MPEWAEKNNIEFCITVAVKSNQKGLSMFAVGMIL